MIFKNLVSLTLKTARIFIKTKDNFNMKSKAGIHITVPITYISEVTLTGSGDIDSKDQITTKKLSASIAGSGNINLAVKSGSVQAEITGSGDITLSGSTSELEVEIMGSGDFNGYKIDSKNTNVTVSGSGDAQVLVQETLVARVKGSGDITYSGNPTNKDIKTLGTGNVSSAN